MSFLSDAAYSRLHLESVSDPERKIESFATLPSGWDYGQGGPVSEQVIRWAKGLCQRFLQAGFSNINAFAGAGGEVVVAAHRAAARRYDIECTVLPDGTANLVAEIDDQDVFEEYGIPREQAIGLVYRFQEELWDATSDLFTHHIMMSGQEDSVRPSLAKYMAESLSSIANAWITLPTPDAGISGTTTQPISLGRRQRSGKYRVMTYPQTP